MAADGLTWRHPIPDDIPAWHRLLQASEQADSTGEHFSEDELVEEFAAPFRRPVDAWFGWDGAARLVAFGWVFAMPHPTDLHRVHLWGTVHPGRRHQGIGAELLARMETSGKALHAEQLPDTPGVLEAHWTQGNPGMEALLTKSGYEPLRHWFQMRCPLDSADGEAPGSLPTGLVLRPFSETISEPMRAAHNVAFRDHWGSTPRDPEAWRHTTTATTFLPGATFAAMAGDLVAGYLISNHYAADAAANGYGEGWISTLGTRREWRGKGIASALIGAALDVYRARGFRYACLAVDTANPSGALGLYERLGFETFLTQVSYAKPI